METNEIMTNEEMTDLIPDVAEEITESSSGKGLKFGLIGGGVVLAAGLAAQYVFKPLWAKRKAKKEGKVIDGKFTEVKDGDKDADDEVEADD